MPVASLEVLEILLEVANLFVQFEGKRLDSVYLQLLLVLFVLNLLDSVSVLVHHLDYAAAVLLEVVNVGIDLFDIFLDGLHGVQEINRRYDASIAALLVTYVNIRCSSQVIGFRTRKSLEIGCRCRRL